MFFRQSDGKKKEKKIGQKCDIKAQNRLFCCIRSPRGNVTQHMSSVSKYLTNTKNIYNLHSIYNGLAHQ